MALRLPHRILFGIMYRMGFAPWDGHPLPAELRTLAEGPEKGRALDLGCGTGDAAIYLAGEGWDVTAVDFVQHALDRAARKARAAGAEVRFVRADVTALDRAGVEGPFELIVDSGLMHGLPDEKRAGYAADLGRLAAPGAHLVLAAFPPGERRGPSGISREEIERRLGPNWELLSAAPAPGASSDASDPVTVYVLRRT